MVRDVRRGVPANPHRYYPSARSILLVRFDPHALQNSDLIGDDGFDEGQAKYLEPTSFSPTDVNLGIQPADDFIDVDPNIGIQPADDFVDVRSFQRRTRNPVAQAFNTNADLAAAVRKVSLEDDLSRFLDVQPASYSRAINGHRLADELSLKLRWKDVPFDARIIRAILVVHFEGTVGPDQFSSPRAQAHIVEARRSNLRFIGFVDEISDSHDEGGDYVSMKCRDLTAPLLDTKLPPALKKKIQPGENLLELISNILETGAGTAMEFIRGPFVRPENTVLPQLSSDRYAKIQTSAANRNRAGTGGTVAVLRNTSKAKGSSDGGESYWDAINDLCVSHGFIPYIDLDRLVIQPPRTLFVGNPEEIEQANVPTFPTPYRRAIGDTASVRRMVFGGNLDTLAFTRKLARIKAPHVRVTSFNPNAQRADQRLISIDYPGTGSTGEKVATSQSPTGKQKQVEVRNVLVHGITDRSVLRAVAEGAYELMGRQELGVRLSSSNLASWSDNPNFDPNEDPDLLALRAGDPLRIVVQATSETGSTFTSLAELSRMLRRNRSRGGSVEDGISFLEGLGWSARDAAQLVRVLNNANLPEEFRVVAASIAMDLEQGDFNISIDARDYVRARADQASAIATNRNLGIQPADDFVF